MFTMTEKGFKKLSEVTIPDYFYERMGFDVPILNELINGDGLVKGQCITLASPKGAGKTTFLLQLCQSFINKNPTCKAIYLSGEECIEQLAFTANRINVKDVVADNVTDINKIAEHMKSIDLCIIDSIQCLTHPDFGTEKALHEYAIATLVPAAKLHGCATIFVQHYTKGGQEKGNSIWGHSVDTTIRITTADPEVYGENVRCIEVEKNRFGSAAEVVLNISSEGFDFSEPVYKKVNPNTTNNTSRAVVKMQQMDKIIDVVKAASVNAVNAKWSDFIAADICTDVGRLERLIKELEKLGKIIKINGGRGSSQDEHRWTIGDLNDN